MEARRALASGATLVWLIVCAPVSSADPNQGLISYWTFDEGSGTTAYDWAGENHGALVNGPLWESGQVHGALLFDGLDRYVEVSDDRSLRFTPRDSFSIAFWALPFLEGSILSKSGRYGLFGYEVFWSGDRFCLSAGQLGVCSVDVYSREVPHGAWCHVTTVYDDRDMRIYLDAEAHATGTFNVDVCYGGPDKDLAIGARSYDSTVEGHYCGYIDDLLIYDRALCDEEIGQIYARACPDGPPAIGISSAEFRFYVEEAGANADPQVLKIANTGVGMLNWAATKECVWLRVEPNAGSLVGGAQRDVDLSVETGGLAGGRYHCQLTISDPCASNSPQLVAVTLRVGPGPCVLLVPAEYETMQAAIDAAICGDTVVVAPGTYTGDGNRDLDFGGKGITVRSTDPNDRCVVAATVINCEGSYGDRHRGLYFHSGEGRGSMVSGLTITNGDHYDGGGIYCMNSSPTIRKCVIINNVAGVPDDFPCGHGCGGGIYCENSSSVISDSSIAGNKAYREFGALGGGVYCGGDVRLMNCLVARNLALGQERWGLGGGIYGSATIVNCTIACNSVKPVGDLPLGYGSGIYGGARVINSIIWGNIGRYEVHGALAGYSNVAGGYPGEGNIDADPCFADVNNGDYHLKSEAGRWEPCEPNSQTWVSDEVTSPCIDAGNPGCPVGDEPEPNGNRINMGAYGGTAEASKSPEGWRSIADLTNDWVVDYNDLAVFVGYWLESGKCLPSDLDRNELVDFADFAIVGECWLRGG